MLDSNLQLQSVQLSQSSLWSICTLTQRSQDRQPHPRCCCSQFPRILSQSLTVSETIQFYGRSGMNVSSDNSKVAVSESTSDLIFSFPGACLHHSASIDPSGIEGRLYIWCCQIERLASIRSINGFVGRDNLPLPFGMIHSLPISVLSSIPQETLPCRSTLPAPRSLRSRPPAIQLFFMHRIMIYRPIRIRISIID